MKIKLATKENENEVVFLFQENLDKNNPAIYSQEFFCPFGLKSAIQRKQVVVVLNEKNEVVAGLRFYPRKRDGMVSLYQFVIEDKYRGKNLLRKMLEKTGYKKFEVLCPIEIDFNEYYKKTDWKLEKKNNNFNYWVLDV